MENNELYHYGVLGMKWGVRKNPQQAYTKAVTKQTKLNKNVDKARSGLQLATARANSGVSAKYLKKQATADKYYSKAERKRSGLFKNEAKANEYQRKADKAQTKANKYKAKYEQRQADESAAKARYAKAQRKAEKWTRAMDKTFADMDINNLPDTTVSTRQNYINKRIYV